MSVGGEVSFVAKLDTSLFDRVFNRIEQALKGLPEIDFKGNFADVYKAADAFGEAISKASQFSQGMDVISGQLSNAAARVQGLSGAAITAANQFENAKAATATLTNDADGLAVSMQALSRDLNFQASSTDLLKASYDVLSAGFVSTADSTEILKASVIGAKGGFSDVGTVSDAVTTVLNAYGRSASDAADITDTLIQTQNLGKITVAQYGALIGRAATIASQAGVSFEEFSAFVSVATVKGVSAESSVTGLRQALSAILKPSKEAADLAQKLGVDFSASALKTKGLTGVLADLRSKGADSVDTLTKLFGSVEAVTAIAPATGEGFKDLQAALEGISNRGGAAASAAEKVSQTYEERVARALNLTNEALVSLGNGVKTALSPVVDAIAFLVQGFNLLPEPIKGAIGVALALTGGLLSLGAVIAGVAAVIPAVQAGFGALQAIWVGSAAAAALQATVTGVQSAALGAYTVATQVATAANTPFLLSLANSIAGMSVATIQTNIAAAAKLGYAQTVAFLSGSLTFLQKTLTLANIQTVGLAAKTLILDGVQKALALTTTALNTALGQNVLGLAKLAVTAGLAVGAVFAVAEAAKALGTAGGLGSALDSRKAVGEIDKLQSKLKEPLPRLGKDLVKSSLDELVTDVQDALGRVQEAFKNRGIVEGSQTALVEYQRAVYSLIPGIDQLSDSTDKFGNAVSVNGKAIEVFGFNFGVLTASQRQAQTAVLNFDAVAQKSTGTLDSASAVLQKYGLSSRKAAEDAVASGKLTTEQISNFKIEAEANIRALDGNIKAVKAYGESNPAAAEQVKALTANLEQQKAALQQRIGLLDGNKQSTATLQQSVADLTAEFDKNQKAIQDSTQQTVANNKELLAGRVISEQDAQASIFKAEKDGLDKRLAANNAQIATLKAKQNGASPEEVAAIQGEILKIEQDSAQTRINIAERVISEQKRQSQEALNDLQRTRESFGEAADIQQSTVSKGAKNKLLDGEITEDDAQRLLTDGRKQAAELRVQGYNAELDALNDARSRGVISAEDAAKKEKEIQGNLRKEEENILDARLEQRKQFQQKALKDLQETRDRFNERADVGVFNETKAVREAQLDNAISEEEAQKRITEARKVAAETRVQGLNEELAALRAARDAGTIDAETAAKKEREIQGGLRKEEENILNARLDLRRQFNAEQIKVAEEANADAEAALRRSQNAQVVQIRKGVLDRSLTEEQASVRIAKLRESEVAGETALIQQKLAENDRFEKEGIRTARDAAKIRRDLVTQLSQQQIAAVDAQIASQKALEAEIIAGIQKRLQAEKSVIDFKSQELELTKTSSSQQLSLLDAQLGLQNALNGLQAGRIQNALAEQSAQASADEAALKRALDQATTEEDKAKIQVAIEEQKRQTVRDRVALEEQAAQQQLTALLKAQEIERQQLELKAQMQRIDADRAEKQAEIAVLEAQAAVATAKARGASADELAILEKTVGLRQEQLKLAGDNKGITDQQIALQNQATAATQQTALEAAQSNLRQTQVKGQAEVRAVDFDIATQRIARGVDANDPNQKILIDQQKKIDLSNPINRDPNFNPNGLPPEVAKSLSQQRQPVQSGQVGPVPGAIAPGQTQQGQSQVISAQPVFLVDHLNPLRIAPITTLVDILFTLTDIKNLLGGGVTIKPGDATQNPVTANPANQPALNDPLASTGPAIAPGLTTQVPVTPSPGIQAQTEQSAQAISEVSTLKQLEQWANLVNQAVTAPRSLTVVAKDDPLKEATEIWEGVNRGNVQGALM